MIRRLFLTAVMALLPGMLAAQPGTADFERRVRETHAAARPLDAHVDVLMPTTPGIYRTDDGVSQVTVDKLVAGGLATVTLAIQSPTGPATAEGVAKARAEVDAKLARIHALVEANADRLALARSAAEVERAHANGRIAVLIGFQNAYALGTDLSLVEHYAAEGVRVLAFNHAGNNAFADSSRPAMPEDEPHDGLSALGEAAVRRLNDLGVVIDVSQLTPRGVMETLQLSRAPVIASHSAVRALVDETRNLSDAELDAIGAKGGVVHVPPFNTYLAPRPPDFVARLGEIRSGFGLPAAFKGVLDDAQRLEGAARGEYTSIALETVPRATLEDYLNHLDYVVKRIGIDHVGIGTDFDHGAGIIGFKDASEAPNVTRALLERGYSADDIAKIWSGNFMRVLRAVEAAASSVAWQDLPDWSGVWAMIGPTVFDQATVEPRGGLAGSPGVRERPPYTPAWEAKYRANVELVRQGLFPDPISTCGTPHGFPRLMNLPDVYEFVVRPEQTWIIGENGPSILRIYTDGRAHPGLDDLWPTFTGDSVGHWERDTLVFDTVAIKGEDGTILDRTGLTLSQQAHIVTRIRKIDAETLEAQLVIEDPLALAAPWHVTKRYRKQPAGSRAYDYACAENNRNPISASGETLTLDADGNVLDLLDE